ncbi:MAG: hypothetical protein IH986_06780 [Planctomycetes bacterium]|nr:hypothetical protein [Planctomycetota bacterium]
MKAKTIDCVKMKRDIQRGIYKEIKDLSVEEQLAWFHEAADGDSELARKFRRLRPTVWGEGSSTTQSSPNDSPNRR